MIILSAFCSDSFHIPFLSPATELPAVILSFIVPFCVIYRLNLFCTIQDIGMAPVFTEISTRLGELKGLIEKSAGLSNKTYYSFQGIPYAKPPVGKLRFKAPEPYGPFDRVQDATREGSDSLQQHMFFKHIVGDEDCLYLNVYTPQEPGEEGSSKAVMVWIHGGGFARGSGSTELYGPDFFIEQDIVLVSINYRCGALGFLSLENDKVPGNAGLKDQTLALRWVQENIDSFGGDPSNVTIFGESAGAASVHYHLLSPLSRGLFHKAILQSGSSLCQWAFQTKPKQKAILLAEELGCTSQDPEEVLEFLMSVPAIELVKAQDKDTLPNEKEKIQTFSLLFMPCVDSAAEAPFLPDYPRKMMERGDFSKVPLVTGVVDKEGLLALALKEINCEKLNKDLSVLVPENLNISRGSEEELELGKEILKFYTDQETLSWDTVHGYVDFVTDTGFAIAHEDSRQSFLKHNSEPVYSYLFTYTSLRAYSSLMIPMAYPEKASQFVFCGAGHGDELIHLFKSNMPQVPFLPPTGNDQSFMNTFVKTWTTFAKTGDPNCNDLGVTWKPDNIKNPNLLELGKVFKTVNGTPFPERMTFWNNIYKRFSHSY